MWWPLLWLGPAGAVRGEDAALSASRCKDLKEMDLIKTAGSHCYCYNPNSQIQWTYMWSTPEKPHFLLHLRDGARCCDDISLCPAVGEKIHPKVYGIYQLMEELKWLWYENGKYILGYVLLVGCLSFAVCYKHGPLVEARSRTLLLWALRLLSLVLIHAGVAVPQLAYAAMLLLLCS